MNEHTNTVDKPRLFMVLLGSKAPGRTVEQHDYFFGIAHTLKELVPEMKAFWPEAGTSIHVDGWREVTNVEGHAVSVVPPAENISAEKLFFINLGGYQEGKLAEQHYTVLTVQNDRTAAIQHSKKTVFFKTSTVKNLKGANAHIDEKYGIDVDDIYRIEDVLSPRQKKRYHIHIHPVVQQLPEDKVHLGYFKLDKIV